MQLSIVAWGASVAIEPLFRFEYDDDSGTSLLPAQEGSWSLEGLAYSLTLVSHFAFEGRIRHRAPFSEKFDIFVSPPERGSWATQFVIDLHSPEIWAAALVGMLPGTVGGLVRLIRRTFSRATGQAEVADGSERLEDRQPGTFEALVEAVEPSLRRAHRVIRDRHTTISLDSGPVHIQFDEETRDYIETSLVDPDVTELVGNVASYNVNSRMGRVFLDQLNRTVPFRVAREATPRTEIALARSLENYARNRIANRDLILRFIATRARDGRLKRVLIFEADFQLR